MFFRTARYGQRGGEPIPVGILDLIFIQGIPRRQEFRAINHALSFDGPGARNAKGEPITADYSVVRLYAATPAAHFKPDFLLADSGAEALHLPPRGQPLASELFRIIIFVSERHPRGSKLKLSFLAIAGTRDAPTKTNRADDQDVPRRTETGAPCMCDCVCVYKGRRERERGNEVSLASTSSLTTVFRSRELRFRFLPLAPVFPLALPTNPHVLIFPGISACSLRLCKGLCRGVDRSSCCSCVPRNKTSILRAQTLQPSCRSVMLSLECSVDGLDIVKWVLN